MADRGKYRSRDRSGGHGRVTPKGGVPPRGSSAGAQPRTGAAARLSAETPVQVGRRPSSTRFLMLVGVMWLAVGAVMMLTLTATWRFIPGIVSIGIGLMFLRGAGATELRREHRRSSGR